MRQYVVQFKHKNLASPVSIYSGTMGLTTHSVDDKSFKDLETDEQLRMLFNGEYGHDGHFTLVMGFRGPILERSTVFAPVTLDDVPIHPEAALGKKQPIPLGVPSKHQLQIGHLDFEVLVRYTE